MSEPSDPTISEEEAKLDAELEALKQMRLALAATLQQFQAVRDDLGVVADQASRLKETSAQCRASKS